MSERKVKDVKDEHIRDVIYVTERNTKFLCARVDHFQI